MDQYAAVEAPAHSAVEFFGHQSAIPGENGIGFGEARDWLQAFAP